MKPLTDFISRFIILLLFLGVFLGVTLKSCGRIVAEEAGLYKPRKRIDTSDSNIIRAGYSASRISSQDQYDWAISENATLNVKLRQCQGEVHHLTSIKKRLEQTLEDAEREIVNKTKEFRLLHVEFGDSLVVLKNVRQNYFGEVAERLKIQRILDAAEQTIVQLQVVIEELDIELNTALDRIDYLETELASIVRTSRIYLILLIILISLFLIGTILYWLNAKGKIDLSKFARRKDSTSDLE